MLRGSPRWSTTAGASGRSSPRAPEHGYGDIVLWRLDRMVRTRAPLVEPTALDLHDRFAASNAGLGLPRLTLRENALPRRRALGGFGARARDAPRLRDAAVPEPPLLDEGRAGR